MIPYYQDDYATIYHGDCMEILPQLPQVDLVIADPPYGMNYQSKTKVKWNRHDKIKNDLTFPLWIFEKVKPLNAMFIFCRWDNIKELPGPKSVIVWDKEMHSMGDLEHEFGRSWEACLFYPGKQHKFTNRRPVDIIRCLKVPPHKLIHPNQKPKGVFFPILESHTGLILDPFMGSGTTLVAAKDLQRQSIGIEIEEKYCEIAAKRLEQEVLPFSVSEVQ